MTIQQAKELDMVDYLSKLGHEPKSIKGVDYWYLSPFGDEKTASFKVNRAKNLWYDFRDGRGGNMVDFGIRYHDCNISTFLQKISSPTISIKLNEESAQINDAQKNKIEIISVLPIASFALMRYINDRRINLNIADKYLKEVRYKTGDKIFYALGFKNDSGGYELRNEKFKGSSSPKESTFIDNQAKQLTIFEGFFNFLSYLTLYNKQQLKSQNFLILNSASFFEKNLPRMEQYEKVNLYLDNDKTGQNCTRKAIDLNPQKFKDQRTLYQNYNDLNDWLINFGRTHKQQQQQKP